MPPDVIVIGAGAAGLAAALDLSRASMKVEILEARDRVGGRIFTQHNSTLNHPAELGAEFVHGMAPEIWILLQQNKLRVNEVQGDLWCSVGGKLQQCNFFSQADRILSEMTDTDPDESFLAFLERRFPGQNHGPAKDWATRYVGGFNAADPGQVSVHWLVHSRQAEEQIEGDRAFRIAGGYQKLLDIFAKELGITSSHAGTAAFGRPVERSSTVSVTQNASSSVAVHLNTIVRDIHWGAGSVRVEAETPHGNATFEAPRVLITLPLGVLQAGDVRFTPELPRQKISALDHLVMGKVIRATLCFREPFWERLHPPDHHKTLANLSFLFSQDNYFPTWWTQMPGHLPIITGWSPAHCAERMTGMTDGRIIDQAIESLSSLLGLEKSRLNSQLNAAYLHDWDSDPFSRGAYSYVKAGGEGCQAILASPLANTLFFAGEHTDVNGHNGTVHGAIASGKRAAQEVLKPELSLAM